MNFVLTFLRSDLMKSYYSDAIRHGCIALAGFLVARGYLHQGDVTNFVSAGVMVAVTWGWQIWENSGQVGLATALQQNVASLQANVATLQTTHAQIAQVAQAAQASPVAEVAQVGVSLLSSLLAAPAAAAATQPATPPPK
jgi:hypothetical protein